MSAYKDIIANSHRLAARQQLQAASTARDGHLRARAIAQASSSLQSLKALEGTTSQQVTALADLAKRSAWAEREHQSHCGAT